MVTEGARDNDIGSLLILSQQHSLITLGILLILFTNVAITRNFRTILAKRILVFLCRGCRGQKTLRKVEREVDSICSRCYSITADREAIATIQYTGIRVGVIVKIDCRRHVVDSITTHSELWRVVTLNLLIWCNLDLEIYLCKHCLHSDSEQVLRLSANGRCYKAIVSICWREDKHLIVLIKGCREGVA